MEYSFENKKYSFVSLPPDKYRKIDEEIQGNPSSKTQSTSPNRNADDQEQEIDEEDMALVFQKNFSGDLPPENRFSMAINPTTQN